MSEEMYDELAALLALDALDSDEQADAELRFGTFPAGLSDVTAALAEATDTTPPADLKADMLVRANARRAPDLAVEGVQPCSVAEAFDRTIAEFHDLLSGLSAQDW